MPWVVLVSDIPLCPANHGNRSRVGEMVKALRSAGYQVGYVLWKRDPDWFGAREARDMEELVDDLRIVSTQPFRPLKQQWLGPLIGVLAKVWRRCPPTFKWWVRNVISHLKSKRVGPDGSSCRNQPMQWCPAEIRASLHEMMQDRNVLAVVASYVYLAPALRTAKKNGALGVLDTHDVFHRKAPFYRAMGIPPDWFTVNKQEEAKLIELADLVIAIQRQEARILETMTRPQRVICIEHGVSRCPKLYQPARDPRAVALVASDNPFNIDGLTAFLKDVWPRVAQADQRAALHVYGKLSCARNWTGQRLFCHGFIEEPGEAYANAAIAINPVRYGTGLKIKTVEALAYGRAIVTTPSGAEGLEDANSDVLFIGDNGAAFAAHLLRLLSDPRQTEAIGSRAHAYAQERFDPNKVYAPLLQILASRRGRPFKEAA